MKDEPFFPPDNLHCSLMWMEGDAFYAGSYFKETFSVHPEWNVASGIAQVFFLLSTLFFSCVCHSGCSYSDRTNDSWGLSIPGGSHLLFLQS